MHLDIDEALSMSDQLTAALRTARLADGRERSALHELAMRVRAYRPGRSALLVVGIWLLGLLAVGGVFALEARSDATRRAQVVIGQLRIEQGELLAIAFSPAITPSAPRPAQTAGQLARAKATYRDTLRKLADLGHSDEPRGSSPRVGGTSPSSIIFLPW